MDAPNVIMSLSPPPSVVDDFSAIVEIELCDGEFQNFDFNSFHETLVNQQEHEEKGATWYIPGSGIFYDIKRRIPHYLSDYYQGFHPNSIFSILFMFFTSIAPALAFGFLLDTKTNHELGVVEVLFSTALCGMVYALISGQPMVLVGVTGPISIFTITVYDLSKTFGIPFIQWYSMIGYYTAAFHFILATSNMCLLIKYVTRFSGETFAVLIAVIYIQEGIQQIIEQFHHYSLQAALYGLIMAYVGFLYFFYCLDLDLSFLHTRCIMLEVGQFLLVQLDVLYQIQLFQLVLEFGQVLRTYLKFKIFPFLVFQLLSNPLQVETG